MSDTKINSDCNYSALERLDIKFTELIGAIEEKQVDGQMSNKDHSDYELVCYCRSFIREELKNERSANTHIVGLAFQITESELIQYALLYAEANSADIDSIGKVHACAKEFENKIKSRGYAR